MSKLYDAVAPRIAEGIFKAASKRVAVRFTFPDGTAWGPTTPGTPEFALVDPAEFYRRMGSDLKMGFGESYVAGDWTTGPDTDLADLLTPFAARLATLVPAPLRKLRRVIDRRLPHHTTNTRDGARTNIEAHYDMSNDLFQLFLDETMTYSSAWFDDFAHESLEDAQLRKLDGILDYAQVGKGTRVLEIGSGWGSLAIRAAERGATVTSITLSQEQAELGTDRIKHLGLDDLASIQIVDYRDVQGEFDAIVSIEMIEAVGAEFWPSYFSAIDRHLAPGGRAAIQAILMSHERMLETRNSYGWIQKYIFPGGLIPSLQAIEEVCATHTDLQLTDRRELGLHYAETLHRWRESFNANWEKIRPMGFDEDFRRIWEFYLAYCEAGFASRYLGVSQLRFARPGTPGLMEGASA
ncbi:MAG: class I SAM-dependent methyltransferase [Nocardioidaceae bacterium]|nr:class I SAM-dependent methyltransferase [Nocardioidaceae bacterium]